MKFPRFRGHPVKRDNARGVLHAFPKRSHPIIASSWLWLHCQSEELEFLPRSRACSTRVSCMVPKAERFAHPNGVGSPEPLARSDARRGQTWRWQVEDGEGTAILGSVRSSSSVFFL